MEVVIKSIKELPGVAEDILKKYKDYKIFFLYGNLGAGKTTLVQAFCKQLGIKEPVTSPTFAIIQEYKTGKGQVYHLDLYRIKNHAELEEIGIQEYLESGSYCFIEWPQLLEDFIEQPLVKVEIIAMQNEKRNIKLRVV